MTMEDKKYCVDKIYAMTQLKMQKTMEKFNVKETKEF